MFKYKLKAITTGGELTINAQTNELGEVVATFIDTFGTWAKTYFDVESFKDAVKSFRVLNQLSISETNDISN